MELEIKLEDVRKRMLEFDIVLERKLELGHLG